MADVFVFGSNLAGRHGKGAALHARKHFGAIYGKGEGRQGNSYAIPTKDGDLNVLHVRDIHMHVLDFLNYARNHWEESFNVTEVGCGLAGYHPEDIAPMFIGCSENVNLPESFKKIIKENNAK